MTEPDSASTEKTQMRRRQILDAACACVRRDGFHGASMAEIAKAANLSVGQIYRYFENKEAIIAAIVGQDLAEMREKFAAFDAAEGPLLDTLLAECSQAVCQNYDPQRAGLMLEVLAEAARNPRVAAIVQTADAAERALGLGLLARIAPEGCSEADLAARGEVLSMLFDGMATRAVNNPSGDRAAIGRLIGLVMRFLLERPPIEPLGQSKA